MPLWFATEKIVEIQNGYRILPPLADGSSRSEIGRLSGGHGAQ
jgi:hypothetical protein